MATGTGFLLFLIAVVTGLLARAALRKDAEDSKERQNKRGSPPGKGVHELNSNYMSGMGGGNDAKWTVPRDPQEYAKRFVPKDAKK